MSEASDNSNAVEEQLLRNILKSLHLNLSQKLLDQVLDEDVDPRVLSVARQMLKDNDISLIDLLPASNADTPHPLRKLGDDLPYIDGKKKAAEGS